MKIDVGFSQLETRLPLALPTGTRLVAIPPTAAPRANGVRIEETEKIVSITPDSRAFAAPRRIAYAAPRKMIPKAAMNRATASVEAIDPNAFGYEVHKMVSTKINHTWLASHTGAIEWWACSRTRSACSPPPANSCQKPAPKSAPASTVYIASPTSTKTIGSACSIRLG